MKIIAGCVIALAIIAGTGTAIALGVKPQRTLTEEGCIGLSCWPNIPAVKHKRAQPSTVVSGLNGQPELESQAGRIDRSQKADRIKVVVRTTETVLPPGCEPPFSSLAKLRSPYFSARC